MALQVYTASLLKEGLVAYLCVEKGNAYWSTDLGKAETFSESAIASFKADAERAERENIVVAPYAIDVEISDSEIAPTTKREQIRANGPTVSFPQFRPAASNTVGLHAA